MTIGIVWRYREANVKAHYTPDWDHNVKAETVWWGIPIVLIVILSLVTWQSTHALDPFKPLNSGVRPLTVQVVALQYRWLFIYPEYGVATMNYLHIPEGTPINFQITSDAPMNSFWIPQLGGQIYAMSGMSTELHLQADKPGVYQGVSANISGEGFADMRFTAEATTTDEFLTWVDHVKNSTSLPLDATTYAELAKPHHESTPTDYYLKAPGLYDMVLMKYMSEHDSAADVSHTDQHSESVMDMSSHGGM
jgi:cytochrome o ubiquinol oxidase subunit 2